VGDSVWFVLGILNLFQQKYQVMVCRKEGEILIAIQCKALYLDSFHLGNISDTESRYAPEEQSHTSLLSFTKKTHNQL